ncbi:MAG: sugar ABC transporter substrate-binding protein, partial [Mesorhizobium sp.]
GYVTAVVQQDPAGMGEAAVKALDTITRGGSVDKNVAVPVTIVTKDNVEPYRAVFK